MRWYGNKSRYFEKIKPYIYRRATWIEPFSDGLGMAVPVIQNLNFEHFLVNDINKDLYNVYTNLANIKTAKQLLNKISSFIQYEYYFKILHKKYISKDFTNDIEWAYIFLIVKYYSFLNSLTSTFGQNTNNTKLSLLKDLNQIKELFITKNVKIFNKDWRKFFNDMQDRCRKNVFIYCDPPYNKTDSVDYDCNFEITELFQILNQDYNDEPCLISYNNYSENWQDAYNFYLIEKLNNCENWRASDCEVLIANKNLFEKIENNRYSLFQ